MWFRVQPPLEAVKGDGDDYKDTNEHEEHVDAGIILAKVRAIEVFGKKAKIFGQNNFEGHIEK